MGLIRAAIERRATYQQLLGTLKTSAPWLEEWAGGGRATSSGQTVTPRSALWQTTVWACVRILSETLASVPLVLYERVDDETRRRATDHPLYGLLHDQPNRFMTSFTWREMTEAHVLTHGNGYSRILRDGRGKIAELMPMLPDHVNVRQADDGSGRVVYEFQPEGSGKAVPFEREAVLHMAGLGFDGLKGYSPVRMAREAIGLTAAAEAFGGRFFGNSAISAGWIENPAKTMNDDQRAGLLKVLKTEHGGERQWSPLILHGGLKWNPMTMPLEDAQFLETRSFQVRELARWFGVPLALLEEHDKASTYASVEQFMISFAVHRMRPRFVRWEQELNRKLLGAEERRRFFFEFLMDGLLRGDLKSRYEAFMIGREGEWLSPNDVRRFENMNPIEGGDSYKNPRLQASKTSGEREPVRSGARPLLVDVFTRLLKREKDARARVLAKGTDPGTRERRLQELYDEHGAHAYEALLPTYQGLRGAAAAEDLAREAAIRYTLAVRAARRRSGNVDENLALAPDVMADAEAARLDPAGE